MKKVLLIITAIFAFGKLSFSQETISQELNLMPWPKEINQNPSRLLIDGGITISISSDSSSRIRNAAVNFLRRLSNRTGVFLDEGFPLINKEATINVSFENVSTLRVQNDESYTLDVQNTSAAIHAKTDVGAIRGLETLLQLIQHDNKSYYFSGVTINDAPRFVWRGLMLDVSRHFHPLDVIKRNLDAMASVKMNVFHWHLTDDQGFRVESKVFPKLQKRASDGLYYTQEQIKEVVAYADQLGIRVIPEFDVPGHASAILTAYPELGSKEGYDYQIERFSGVFDPTLNPTKDVTYFFLESLFTEMAPLFPDEYFHIGGDENAGKHWDENEEIQKFKKAHGLETNHDLQTYFNIKLEKILNGLGKKLMGWDEIMTPDMPKTAVIHSWRGVHEGLPKGGSLIRAAKAGYQTVLSNGFYIDRMFPVAKHYAVDPIGDIELTSEERSKILGGETTMWSELVTPLNVDSRIWPRTAAIAERFWSPKSVNDIDNMTKRLKEVSANLEELGITHMRNRDVILRGMTHNQDIAALLTLSKICEPLKLYTRNKGGTEYKTYSPFNLFADACVVDAEDAPGFSKAVANFISGSNSETVLSYLNKWSGNYAKFSKLKKNPKTNPLENLSKQLSAVSGLLSKAIQDKNLPEENLSKIRESLTILKEPVVDVELAILEPLNKLADYCETELRR